MSGVRLEWAAIYAGLNILLLLVLAVRVARGRQSKRVVLGDGGDADFIRLNRAHANAAEYIPAGIGGLILLALLEPAAPTWLLHVSGVSLTLGRVIHAIGLNAGPLNTGRILGIALTWLAFLLMGVGLIYAGFAHRL